ncbi:hypothetical protein CTRI78_v011993 [Colletotrichum trifolii]|uniref:Uncharacterized protein n=1 Tax=Colletotrichum trifolii TaxID=5466 RepID=A0A4R8Q4F7_COLTR|nr:hypothetical protein CTRI78_v011993 [Colletotrichum trifolii]
MVSIKNIVSFLTLAASSFGVDAAYIPASASAAATSDFSPVKRETLKERFQRETNLLIEMGRCRSYDTGKDDMYMPEGSTCKVYCQNLTGDSSSYCDGSNLMSGKYQDPFQDNRLYMLGGTCTCVDMPDEILYFIEQGVQGLGVVTCTVWVTSAKLVVDYGLTTLIPGGKPALETMKKIAKVIQKLSKAGLGKDAWYNVLKSTCGEQGVEVQENMKTAFDMWASAELDKIF